MPSYVCGCLALAMSENIQVPERCPIHGVSQIVQMNREFTCKCGALLNAIGSHFTNRLQPEPGDATICQYCGTWWIFEEVGVRLFTQTDYERLTDNEASHFNEATVRAMKRINGAQPG